MEEQHLNGGLQYVPQIAVQYVYLDFDGELTSYNGDLLTIDNVSVQESALTEERIAHIAAELNAEYASQNVIFVTQRPETAGYSTIFIGKTSAFDPYGSFAGLAETIDTDNQNKTDNAFVTLDSTAANTQIIATIAHETDHLLGILNHGGEGLEAYAYYLRYGVSSGVTSTGITLNTWDSMYVSSGGTANSTTVNEYGYLSVFSGGTANSTIVNPGGRMYISSGGTATEIIENGGYVYAHDYAEVTFVSNTITGLTLFPYASMTVHKNTIANHTTVNSGGFMYISSGGVANYTTINYSGHMYIFPSGVVNHTTVNYSFMYISSGGTANNTTIKGTLKIGPGGVAKNATVYSDGELYVSFSGDAYGVKLLQGGWLGGFSFAEDKHFESIIDGKAVITDNVYVVGNEMHVSSSGTVSNAAVNSYGYMYVFSGGTANSTTVNSYGRLYVSSGGTANSTTVNSYGYLYVSSGGTASIVFNPWQGTVYSSAGAVVEYLERDANIYYGGYDAGLISKADAVNELQITSGNSAIIYAGGTANSTTVNSYGSLYVSSGGTANRITVNYSGSLNISSGGTANSTTVNSYGSLYVSSGGTANSTTVNRYGSLYVSSGGTANRITVNYSGSLNISSGGMLHGALQITKGAIVSAYSGAKIDFTVSERTSSDGYLINDLSLISGLPTYSITISDDQASGTYKLAQGAEKFAGTVSIGTNGNNYGMITVNGSDFVYNKTVYSLDKINGTLTLTISERDITPPDLNITGNAVTWTNKNVVLNASSNEEVSFEYSFDGTDWLFGCEVTVEENRIVYFKATDRVGNVAKQTVVVDKIDKIAPTKSTVRANITQSTNQDVTVTAEYSSDCVVREYSTDNRTWKTYLSGIVMKENGTVYFRGTDAAGNISDVTVYEVTNIDKVAPLKPIASANITALTNQDVTLTAVYSSDSVVKEYSLNNQTWLTYTTGVILSFNGTVYFRGTDAVGNISDVAVYEVTNIDKVAPEKTAVRANTTQPTNQDVSLTAEYSSDSAVKEYSFNNQTWQTYTKEIVLASNGTVYFRGTDAAGNISDVTVYEVTNIDKVAPLKPIASANITALTNQDVTLTAVYSSDSVVKEYSLNNQTWQTYTAGVILSSNGTVYFRGTDAAGNISDITVYEVTNIDKVAPVKPVVSVSMLEWTDQNVFVSAAFASDSVKNEYAVNGGEWQIYSSAVEFAANGTISFRSTDAAGNISDVTVYEVTNIDKVAPLKPIASANITALTNQDVTLTAVYSSDSVVKEYSLNNQTWLTYTTEVVLSSNGTVYFRGTDAAGNISDVTIYEVTNIDKLASTKPTVRANTLLPTNQDVTLTAVYSSDSVVKEYSLNNQTWLTYTTGVVLSSNGTVYFRGTDAAGNISDVTVYEVTNIDKVAPEKPVVRTNTTQPTNQDVTLTAVYSSDSVVKEYSLNNQTWLTYTTGVVLSSNGTVYFRGTDAAGNISDVTAYEVTNIDKVAPSAPVAVLKTFTEKQQNLVLTVDYSADSVIKQYSTDQVNWQDYTSEIPAENLVAYYFRCADAAGNFSDTIFTVGDYRVKTFSGGALVDHGSRIDSASLTAGGVSAMYVSSGGLAYATIVGQNAQLQVLFGGSAWQTKVAKSALLNVRSGAVFSGITVSSGGFIKIANGGMVYDLTLKRYANTERNVLLHSSGGPDKNEEVYGDRVTQITNAAVSKFTLESRCVAEVADASLYDVQLHSAARLTCFAGEEEPRMFLSGAVVLSDARLNMEKYTVASAVTVSKAGTLKVQNGGSAYHTVIDREGKFEMLGDVKYTTLNGGSMYVGDTAYHNYDGTGGMPTSNVYDEDIHAEDNVLNSSWMHVYSGGTATSNVVNSNSWLHTYYGGTATSNTVNSSGYLTVHGSGTIDTTTVHSGGYLRLYTGAVLKGETCAGGKVTVHSAGTSATEDVVRAYGADIYFLLNERTVSDDVIITDLGMIMGATFYITVAHDQASGIYKLAGGASDFTGTISIGTNGRNYGALTVNGTALSYGGMTCSLVKEADQLMLSVTGAYSENLSGNKNGIEFPELSSGTHTALLSQDDFNSVLRVETTGDAVDFYNLPAGTFQWQVDEIKGQEIVSDNTATPQEFVSDADGRLDLFFARASGVWEAKYAAQHQGNDLWEGTNEQVLLAGKNRLADVFAGSEDANILVLTDDPNGDALFVDDIFTALGDQARFSQIDEIRAGAGDDIVDMTSQRFTYTGSGITVYGGLGDDVIWGSNGDHILFGDDGNDRITGGSGNDIIIGGAGNDLLHGGGGSDIFCFNAHCGNDSVEQLSDGRVTLYFEADTGYWDPEKLTYYFDADNSVSVTGVGNDRIELFFGAAAELPEGCFDEAASEKIFEDKNKGMLA